jgi:NAD(P)-dependent dehydrogenase (short-subunit alcohol dehydrogenase family)
MSPSRVVAAAEQWRIRHPDQHRVNTITPGPCDTPLIDTQVSSPEEAAAVRAKHAANIPRTVHAVGRILPTPFLGGLHHLYVRV